LESCGFREAAATRLTCGVVSVYQGTK
jgi:hypothetical protein